MLLRYDPEAIAPRALRARVQALEESVILGESPKSFPTRILEIPVWYDDPETHEVMQRFRANHQTSDKTDLEYVAEINSIPGGPSELIKRHYGTPWMVTAVGFVAALPFMYQLAPKQDQIQAPKYLSPRTDTPPLTVGHAGCFCCIYSVRGAGGYQMFGMAAAPIFAPNSALPDFRDSMILFQAGDIVKFRPVNEDEFLEIRKRCDEGVFRYRKASVEFDLTAWEEDPSRFNASLMEKLNGTAD
jgi:urea carboxylase